MIAAQKKQAQTADALELPSLTTFSENLVINDTPFGEDITIDFALNGNWKRVIKECNCPFNQHGATIAIFHESLHNKSQTEMPETSYETTQYFKNAMVFIFVHRNKAGKADYCNLVFPTEDATIKQLH